MTAAREAAYAALAAARETDGAAADAARAAGRAAATAHMADHELGRTYYALKAVAKTFPAGDAAVERELGGRSNSSHRPSPNSSSTICNCDQ